MLAADSYLILQPAASSWNPKSNQLSVLASPNICLRLFTRTTNTHTQTYMWPTPTCPRCSLIWQPPCQAQSIDPSTAGSWTDVTHQMFGLLPRSRRGLAQLHGVPREAYSHQSAQEMWCDVMWCDVMGLLMCEKDHEPKSNPQRRQHVELHGDTDLRPCVSRRTMNLYSRRCVWERSDHQQAMSAPVFDDCGGLWSVGGGGQRGLSAGQLSKCVSESVCAWCYMRVCVLDVIWECVCVFFFWYTSGQVSHMEGKILWG